MIGVIVLAAFQTIRYTPQPNVCAMPFRNVTVAQHVDPTLPAGFEVTQPTQTVVSVLVGPDGSVIGASVSQSSGDNVLDRAALQAAQATTYQPKIVDCTPAAGTYMYTWNFGAAAAPKGRDQSPAPANPCNHDGSISKSADAVLPATTHFQQPLTALVRVTIGTNGELIDAKIAQSTGNDTVDMSALDAAKHSTYAPKFVSCKAVVASYIYKIVFKPH